MSATYVYGLVSAEIAVPAGLAGLDGAPVELVAQEFRVHLMKAEAMQPDHYERDSGNPYYDAAARIKLLDEKK